MRTTLSVALLSCAVSACAPNQPYLTHEPSPHKVDEFTAPKGAVYTVTLPFSAGTGYAWTASRFDEKVMKLAGQSSRRASGDAIAGGPMIEEMIFNLVGKGETIIVFELKRPWEKDVSAVDTRSVKVTVK
jgi:predicted secreted protein